MTTRKPLVTITMPDTEGGKPVEAPIQQRIHLVPACPEEFRIANIKANMERDLPRVIQPQDFHRRRAIIVGFGPTLHQTWPELLTKDEPSDIFTVSGAHAFLMERGIAPYAHTECDPREHKHTLLTKLSKNCRFYIASRAHSTMFDHLKDYDVRMYHTGRQEPEMQFIRSVDPTATIVSPASMIGLQCVQLCFFLGYRKFTLYGLDCSFPKGQQHAGPHPNSDPTIVEVGLDGADRRWFTTFSMLCSLTDFFNLAISHPMGTFELRGDGLLQTAEKIARTKVGKGVALAEG